MTPDERALFESACQVVYREGMLLDEQRWDDWLGLYKPDCVYWLPMWSEEGVLTPDTDRALSYIFYESRSGLEDRVMRFTSRRSPATTPMPRTCHLYSNLLPLAPPLADEVRLRAAWTTQVMFLRGNVQHAFFGWTEYTLHAATEAADQASSPAAGWRIARKKIVLLNDQIPTMLDVYCI